MIRSCLIVLFVVAATGFARAAEPPVKVGCKIDIETAILQHMAAQLLSDAHVPVTATAPLGGTNVLFATLEHGDIDVYPEYTGTLSAQVLHDPSLRTVADLRPALAARGIGITESLGFDDTYALGMTAARADALHLSKISDLAAHPEIHLGFSTEFAGRADGWPGVRAAYGLPDLPVQRLDHQLAYRALLAGQVDVTDLYSTDAEVVQHGLRVLADDRAFFPAYRAVYVYRLDLKQRFPAAIAALERLVGRIDAAQMQAMNAADKIDHRAPADIAAEFLHRTFGITAATNSAAPSMLRQLGSLTRDHLILVGISLAAAIALALPLGVVAAEFPRLGQGVLIVVAAIYTIPSLALLVFMVSLLHLAPGTTPAVLALFLYSLLPIVRNTQAGLRAVPPQLRESAEVLGLGRWARLLRVEVPLASPAILAGIKTAAVLNVGTAALGGFIGAGGYGQAIFQGIIEGDNRRVLLGAVPAAVMALAIQAGFDLIEPLLVPRGLRLKRHDASA